MQELRRFKTMILCGEINVCVFYDTLIGAKKVISWKQVKTENKLYTVVINKRDEKLSTLIWS